MRNKLKLLDITLFAISSIYIPQTIAALILSAKDIEFGKIKLLTDHKPDFLPEEIEYVEIPKINNIMDYNQFCFSELGQYISTSHGLLVQYHGWIISPETWNNDWLSRDYLGAIWPLREGSFRANTGEIIRNGNGGFSLRSRYLMSLPKKMNWSLRQDRGFFNEDGNLVCYWRKELLELGINYGTTEEAASFSYENLMRENYDLKTFGFHRNVPNWYKNG